MTEGFSVRQLADIGGKGRTKLYGLINYWLTKAPPVSNIDWVGYKYLVFDGTYIYRRLHTAAALLDYSSKQLLSGEYDLKENSLPQLIAFFTGLKDRRLDPKSLTIDGNHQVIKALRTVWPNIIIQRCLVHIQRQGLMWCRCNPKTAAARKLHAIFLQVTSIATVKEKKQFISNFLEWESRYGFKINQQPERGKVFSDLKRARSLLIKAMPDMFHYLKDKNIPSNTNQVEGYFSRLKDKYHDHRGLSPQKRRSYFTWYFYLNG